jgi:tetratricopeptide (TPR) repeat protein
VKKILALLVLAGSLLSLQTRAEDYSTDQFMQEGMRLEKRAQYFQAARYYFQAMQRASNDSQRGLAYAHISNALIAQGMPQAASYFFLKALALGEDRTIRLALLGTQELVDQVGGVLFKKYALKYTKEDQYPQSQRDYFLYFIAQDHLFAQRPNDVIRAVGDMSSNFPRYPSGLFLRGTANLILGNVDQGVNDFKNCAKLAEKSAYSRGQTKNDARELKNRCVAGVARGYYQGKNYQEAENWYDQVEIQSMVWPQVQYERAWTAVARGDYNRALGRLVSYKAPGLSWFHDSEVEMLRSISYLQMCIYDDVEKESAAFMERYTKVGQEIKALLDESAGGNTSSLVRLFQKGLDAMNNKVHSEVPMHQVMNRFVRSPYFVQIAKSGDRVRKEYNYLNSLGDAGKQGLGGFLRDVLVWRWQTSQEVGGLFVRERLATEYKGLLANVSTIDIIKLEQLRRSRTQVEKLSSDVNGGQDIWGQKKRGSLGRPSTRDNQFFWQFNGEFWADELGDYVFALRPECY